MFKIIYLIICLAILSYKDIRSRTVPVMWLILMGAGIPIMYVCDYKAGGEIIQPDSTVNNYCNNIYTFIGVYAADWRSRRDNYWLCLSALGCVYSSFYSVDIIYYAGSFRWYMGSC